MWAKTGLAAAAGLMLAAFTNGTTALSERDTKNAEIMIKSYPAESLALGEQGAVDFRVNLYRDGRLQSCEITRSSGYPRLDAATCDLMVRYARFKSSERKADARGSYDGQVNWQLPYQFAGEAPPREDEVDVAEFTLECRRTTKVGSHLRKTKMCLTPGDWLKAEAFARDTVEGLRHPSTRNRTP